MLASYNLSSPEHPLEVQAILPVHPLWLSIPEIHSSAQVDTNHSSPWPCTPWGLCALHSEHCSQGSNRKAVTWPGG